MNRRQALALSLLAASARPTLAQLSARAEPITIVKALLFTCPKCMATEAFDPAIDRELGAVGGKLVHAPLPMDEVAAKERIYFAVRDLQPKAENAVRQALYRGTQQAGVSLLDDVQVLVWLQTTLGETLSVNWDAVLNRANSPEGRAPVVRAYRLATAAAVSETPTYIVLRNNEIIDSLDPLRTQGSLGGLREAVINRIKALTASAKKD